VKQTTTKYCYHFFHSSLCLKGRRWRQ
jgi:hypothetical protein